MFYSRSAEYAIVALGALAELPDGDRRMARAIAEEEDVPAFFLAKTLQTLVRQGLLHSTKGPTGGFGLAKPAHRIRLIDVIAALDGLDEIEREPRGLPKFRALRADMLRYFRQTTIADVAAQRSRIRKAAARKKAAKKTTRKKAARKR